MADVHQVITLGTGTPADIPHFVLVGLSPNPSFVVEVPPIYDLTGSNVTEAILSGSTQTEILLSGSKR